MLLDGFLTRLVMIKLSMNMGKILKISIRKCKLLMMSNRNPKPIQIE